jgi:copper transport protein
VRFAAFAALIVLVGGAAFVLALWPAGVGIGSVRRLLTTAWVVAVVSTVFGIALQGAYAAGLGLTDAFRWSVIDAVLDTRFGRVWLVRLVLLAVAAPVLIALGRQQLRQPVRRALIAVAAALGIALLLTPGLAGHAGSEDPVALTGCSDAASRPTSTSSSRDSRAPRSWPSS